MTFHVYILFSDTANRYYVGYTDNVERRLFEHNNGKTRYTSQQASDWKLVYSERFDTRSEAIRRERDIKAKKSRTYIETLVKG